MYDSDASEDTVDRGVVADPNLEGVRKCISSSGGEVIVLRINLDVVEWSKILAFG